MLLSAAAALRRALLVLSVLVSATAQAAAVPWQLAVDEPDVRVWKRPVADSPFVEFRAETVVRSSLSALVGLFYDIDAAPRWIDHTRRVVALSRDDARREYVLLLETDMPWPISDRDAVIKGRWWQEPDTLAVMLRGASVSDVHPENPAYVRNTIRSDWSFIPLGDGRVKVVMAGHVDPRGNLPTWAVNLLIQESPRVTLRNLARIIGTPERQAVVHPGVTEPPPGFVPPPG